METSFSHKASGKGRVTCKFNFEVGMEGGRQWYSGSAGGGISAVVILDGKQITFEVIGYVIKRGTRGK